MELPPKHGTGAVDSSIWTVGLLSYSKILKLSGFYIHLGRIWIGPNRRTPHGPKLHEQTYELPTRQERPS